MFYKTSKMKRIISYKLWETRVTQLLSSRSSLFESVELTDEIKAYLLDIFQELTDIGYKIRLHSKEKSIHLHIEKIIRWGENSGETANFKPTDVDDYILSAIEYMKSVSYKLQWSYITTRGGEEIKYLHSIRDDKWMSKKLDIDIVEVGLCFIERQLRK